MNAQHYNNTFSGLIQTDQSTSDGVSITAIGDFLNATDIMVIAIFVVFNSVDLKNHKSRYFIVVGVIASAVAVHFAYCTYQWWSLVEEG